jgi:XRE family transcriptional regulator, regulator of sulfur utilization
MPTHKRPPSQPPAKSVGLRIRALREERGLSQADLAAKAGIDFATFSKLENGRSGSRGPTLSRLYQVANALGVKVADLVPGV